MPLLRASGLVAGLGSGLILTLGCPAAADPRPSAQDVAKARQEAQQRAHELGKAEADLAVAQARQEDLAANAERLVEAYNGELVKLQATRVDYEQATKRLRRAAEQYQQVREAVAAQAAERYRDLMVFQPAAAMLAGSDSGSYLQRASVFSHLSREQAVTLQQLRDTQSVYAILRTQAARAYNEQQQTAEQVRVARDAARMAVEQQVKETDKLKQEKAAISRRLNAARSRVERLRRAREEARERAANRRVGRYVPSWAGTGVGRGGRAARWALKQLGKPYVWAADGPSSFDCSGLTMRAWQRAGVTLDHWTGTQWTSGPHVPLKRLRSGDLVFYGRSSSPGTIHHVGLYIGRGMMVHAPRTGDVVRISSIWRHDLVGATRPAFSALRARNA
jgi:cell wall-associated NlpC family hydrolase